MAEGRLIGFTSNYADNSTEAGFQFTFFCDRCSEGYKTRFLESKTHRKGQLFRGIGSALSSAAQMTGRWGAGYGAERGADAIAERFEGMTPQWRKEHEAAFELAQNEAKGHFTRCPRCTKWMCSNDFNEQAGLCTDCAPRESTEVAAARAEKMVTDIRSRAAETEVFTGEIESRQTMCPRCGKPAGEGKFCGNCGTSLAMVECEQCGARSPVGTRFCGECGNRLE